MLSDDVNWDNMPREPGPMYPALANQIMKLNRVAQEEAKALQVMESNVFAAFDELRFGVSQLTGEDVRSY